MVSGAQSFKDTGQIGPKDSKAQMLEWKNSDGDKSRRPQVSFTKNADAQGNVNYYRPVSDTEEASVAWRKEIGTYLAEQLGYAPGKVYWMKGWPSGYGFYDHQKGKLPNPRHDLYLCGSKSAAKFRSKNEFLPHALWLMSDLKSPCSCKYCTKSKSQHQVNQNLGLSGPKASGDGRPRAPPKAKVIPQGMTHASRRAAREKIAQEKAAQRSNQAQQADSRPVAVPERVRDLSATDRAFRHLELIWVALKDPIYVGQDKSVAIDFWPGLVVSLSTKNTPSNHRPGDPNYTVECRYVFTVRLLGVNHEIRLFGDRLLPQLGYVPNQKLLDLVKNCTPSRRLDPDFTEYTNFNPMPEYNRELGISPSQYTKRDALPAYCLALHIVACLTPIWSATHSYSGDGPKSSEEEFFQGIWWGSERLWAGDLVRVRVPREHLDPDNAMGLLPPSSHDALTRALLLRIMCIVADPDDPSETGICVIGDLYELALESEQPGLVGKPNSKLGVPTGLLDGGQPSGSSSRTHLPFLNNAQPEKDTFAQDQRNYGVAPVPGESSSTGQQQVPAVEVAYPMPDPPPGYVFRRLLEAENEIVLDVGAIAGRYYPAILQMDAVDTAMRSVNDEYNRVKRRKTIQSQRPAYRPGTVNAFANSSLSKRTRDAEEEVYEGAGRELMMLLSLAGLITGDGNAMEPEQWAKGRIATITGAEKNGRKVLYDQWKSPQEGSSDVEMLEVD